MHAGLAPLCGAACQGLLTHKQAIHGQCIMAASFVHAPWWVIMQTLVHICNPISGAGAAPVTRAFALGPRGCKHAKLRSAPRLLFCWSVPSN